MLAAAEATRLAVENDLGRRLVAVDRNCSAAFAVIFVTVGIVLFDYRRRGLKLCTSTDECRQSARDLLAALAAGAGAVALAAVFFVAPTERTMGDAQRIVYLHVAVAWLGLVGFCVMAAAGAMYLLRRDLAWDHWAQAAAELGWLGCEL